VDSCEHARPLSPGDLTACERAAKEKLARESGAHYVVDDLQDLPAVIQEINTCLQRGENP